MLHCSDQHLLDFPAGLSAKLSEHSQRVSPTALLGFLLKNNKKSGHKVKTIHLEKEKLKHFTNNVNKNSIQLKKYKVCFMF